MIEPAARNYAGILVEVKARIRRGRECQRYRRGAATRIDDQMKRLTTRLNQQLADALMRSQFVTSNRKGSADA